MVRTTALIFRLVPAAPAAAGGQAGSAWPAPWLAAAAGPGRLAPGSDPSVLPADVLIADHRNNRLLIVDPQGRIRWEFPRPGDLAPGQTFLQPDDAFFSPDGGHYLITEINGDWADEMSLSGRVSWSANPRGVLYPSDSNEIYPGRYLTVDYSDPGQVVEFDSSGRALWRMGGFNQPSLALPLPNGDDILLNDDFNHRVCVADPATHRIVWQYGHTGQAGRRPGYLNDPDGVDLVPPDSLLVTHGATMGAP